MDSGIGPMIMLYLHYSDLQKLCTVCKKLRNVKTVDIEHIYSANYMEDRELVLFMREHGIDDDGAFLEATNPWRRGYDSSRIMIGLDHTTAPINAGNRMVEAWQLYLTLKFHGVGEEGMKFNSMSENALSLHFDIGSFHDILPGIVIPGVGENEVAADRHERAIRHKLYDAFECGAQYGCVNTRLTHRMFEVKENWHLCSECMDSPKMDLAKLKYMWENTIYSDDWWFHEWTYEEDVDFPGRVDDEKLWWGLQEDERWAGLFDFVNVQIDNRQDVEGYPVARWIIKGERL
jgi:hypothetical protein